MTQAHACDKVPSIDTSLPSLVVVTGPPAAGKTTIAAELRARLGIPLLAKDTLKETQPEPGSARREADPTYVTEWTREGWASGGEPQVPFPT